MLGVREVKEVLNTYGVHYLMVFMSSEQTKLVCGVSRKEETLYL